MIKKATCMLFLFLSTFPVISGAQTLTITGENSSETIARNQFLLSPADESFVDLNKVQELVDRLNKQVYKHPVNATLNERREIVPEKAGAALDQEAFVKQFYAFFYGEKSGSITLPMKEVHPRVNSELLAEISSKEIGRFTTYFSKRHKERSYNILLAAKAINNHIVFPGEKFSFNKVVGERTEKKGYKRAPVIIKGEMAEDIGGGICQVSSTLFNAVNLEGIEIVERYSHSRKVPYVPPGKDATVSWWGPDFVFKNEYDHPIIIRAASYDGKMIIRVLSSESAKTRKSGK
ncbi:Vancomycin B-type resistance protein VanW [Bacillus badius]|uniref:Vancomycin B-type resistance protein VanW n=2 Tax=Bacillus badius TaxID=1455 RepID=A0ABR5ATD3_BACBA|nr:VanW family protein [Bacillus badius]KIL75534.1 Vancomycin B-type resistance protein VanW [Bacillus badius]KIL77904.1 Vancomycin B-type resistance protein VanW [Bacillus badius]MED4716344.1 VanW family protein [Bacillus badius]